MQRLTFFAAVSVVLFASTQALAQIEATSYSGSFTVDGSPYSGGPILWFSLARISAGGSAPTTSSATLRPEPNLTNNTHGRSVLRYFADGIGDLTQAVWMLPEDGNGGMSAAQAGEARVFSTWTPGWCIAPTNNHGFNSEVTVLNPDTQAWVEVDVQEAPRPFLESITGDFTHSILDNGDADRNDDPGQILLDKFATPVVQIDFSLPQFDMHRPNIFWQDFTESASPFWDQTYSGMVVAFDGLNGFYTFASPISDLVFFEPDEGAISKSLDAFAGSMSIDLSGIRPGEYTVRYWAIPFSADYSDGTDLRGCAGGFIPIEHVEMGVQVVPEPATYVSMAVGALALGRRKRRSR